MRRGGEGGMGNNTKGGIKSRRDEVYTHTHTHTHTHTQLWKTLITKSLQVQAIWILIP